MESDINALEMPLSNLIDEKFPEYQIRFLLQERLVSKVCGKVEEVDIDEENEEDEELEDEAEYKCGGDITTSNFVNPSNTEHKIYNRFIKPVSKKDGIYPKKIAKVIQIVDLDGVYIPDDNVVSYSEEHQNLPKNVRCGVDL